MNTYGILENDEIFAFAKRDMSRERYEDALIKIKVIMSRGPFPIDVFALLGKIYASIGLYQRAHMAFKQFVDQVPEAFVEIFQLGMVEHDMGNKAEAEDLWERVLTIKNDYAPALYHLALIKMDKRQLDDAKDHLNRILETAPDDSEYIALADQILTRLSLQ